MNKENNHITVFEHDTLRFDKGDPQISREQFQALQKYYGNGTPFFSLQRNGVKFKEYVGAIQVGNTLIEVLPKADKNETDKKKWHEILIGMLRAVGAFDIRISSESSLKIKSNSILDLYFEMFIREVEYLLHSGLIKQYRKKEGNVTALKGSLHFAGHIQRNLTHQERFYVRHTTYDFEHKLHFILYKAIRLLRQINTNAALHSRIGALTLHFPEMPDIKVSEASFEKLVFNRKNQPYKKAIEIARLLLLQYHPDLSRGRHHVLALMFDMNRLWERFVYASLRKYKTEGSTVSPQSSKPFWEPEQGNHSKLRPDIVINADQENCMVLDTKWKNLNGANPSPDDLRQMYAYQAYFSAKRVALVYPGAEFSNIKGFFKNPQSGEKTKNECGLICLPVEKEIRGWQKSISDTILDKLPSK